VRRDEVMLIVAELVENYSNFDDSDENIDRLCRYLEDFPFEAAMKYVQEHIKTSKFPPLIADIRGKLGDQMDAQRSKDAAQDHFAQLDAWIAGNTPPPKGYWEDMKRKLRGEADD
jgi:hypothetical protein